MLFELDDQKFAKIEAECRQGERLCGQCKRELAEKVNQFLSNHQRAREVAKDKLHEYWVEESVTIQQLFKK